MMKVWKNLLGESEIAIELSEVDGEELQSTEELEGGREENDSLVQYIFSRKGKLWWFNAQSKRLDTRNFQHH